MAAPTLIRDQRRAAGRPPIQPDEPSPSPSPPAPRASISDDLLTIALALVIAAALVPFQRVYIGPEWIRPAAGAAVLALGVGWGARKLGVGPITHLLMTLMGLLVFITIAFLPATAAFGLLPTGETLQALRDLFVRGLELVELRPSPTFAEAGLLLLTVSGVWIVTYLADGMLFVLRSPTKAVTAAIVLWSVPLAVAPTEASIVGDTLGMLLASGLLLLLGNADDVAAWGARIRTSGSRLLVPPAGLVILVAAALSGLLFAPLLPGYQERPIYTVRGSSGTTITTNPIVNIQQRLVATNTGPVVRVDSPRPMYLRTTSLDTFNEQEEWGLADTIGGRPVEGRVDEPPAVPTEIVQATVQVEGIEAGAILAPTPYQTIEVAGSKASLMRYDPATATLTVSGDDPLTRGDRYRVTAALAQPSPDALRQVPKPADSDYLALPDTVSPAAGQLAREIVATAGAETMFDQALAIQDRLRSWTYTTQPEFGQGDTAMERFINGQQGYCEQFAGTMAVMLRTLGIPARLAVGYTPGTLGPDGLWEVTNANAHAWVEVDFGDLGWITFEPTPRTDGNVLVPNGSSVVPSQTVGMQGMPQDGSTAEPAGPGELPQAQSSVDPRLQEGSEGPSEGGPGGPGQDGGGPPLWLVFGILGLVGGGVVALRRGTSGRIPPPEARIARARRRAERVGTATGTPRQLHETDAEYFHRLAEGHRVGQALAGPSTRADYAPAVTEADARAAESAAAALRGQRLDRATTWQKLRLRLADLRARSAARLSELRRPERD